MSNRQLELARGYAEAVFRRARDPLGPPGFMPDWADRPSPYKTYPQVARLPLPDVRLPTRPVGELDHWPTDEGVFTLETLATMLRASYGVLSWRLRVTWNLDQDRTRYAQAAWARGTPSGGGLYPLEIYWASGPGGPLLPGIYHYATGQHSLVRLLVGDVTERVRQATGYHPDACATDQFLLVSIAFWRNAFKYGDLCYHLVAQDLGALLGCWELVARALRAPMRRLAWFHDRALDELLGLDTRDESVFAVVPLPWRGSHPARPGPKADGRRGAPVNRSALERSRNVHRFARVERVHRACLVTDEARPEATPSVAPGPAQACGPAVALAPPRRLDTGLGTALMSRRSAFGSFSARPAVSVDDLGTVLAFAAASRRYRADVKPATGDLPFTRLSIVANGIDGLAPGGYAYDDRGHVLRPVGPRRPPANGLSAFLQRHYLLDNYSLDRVGAVVVITGRLEAMLATYGNRGYRILNAEAGAVAQSGCVAAAAAGVGCGTVLGLDTLAVDELLGLDGTDERSLLFLLLGSEPTIEADLDYRLGPPAATMRGFSRKLRENGAP